MSDELRLVVVLDKARKVYTDKLGRTWRWDAGSKKYRYVKKSKKTATKLKTGTLAQAKSAYPHIYGRIEARVTKELGIKKLGSVAHKLKMPQIKEICNSRFKKWLASNAQHGGYLPTAHSTVSKRGKPTHDTTVPKLPVVKKREPSSTVTKQPRSTTLFDTPKPEKTKKA